jgi:hypothetical protein
MHKGFKYLDVASGRVYISCDVVFNETVFPFAKLNPNAGARLRSDILLLHTNLPNPTSGVDGIDASCAGVHLSPVSTNISQVDVGNTNPFSTTAYSSGGDLAQTSSVDSHAVLARSRRAPDPTLILDQGYLLVSLLRSRLSRWRPLMQCLRIEGADLLKSYRCMGGSLRDHTTCSRMLDLLCPTWINQVWIPQHWEILLQRRKFQYLHEKQICFNTASRSPRSIQMV